MSDDPEETSRRKAFESLAQLGRVTEGIGPGEPEPPLPREIVEKMDSLIAYSRLLLVEQYPDPEPMPSVGIEIPGVEIDDLVAEEAERQGITQGDAVARKVELGIAFDLVLGLTKKPAESLTDLEREAVSCLQDLYGPLASYDYIGPSDPM